MFKRWTCVSPRCLKRVRVLEASDVYNVLVQTSAAATTHIGGPQSLTHPRSIHDRHHNEQDQEAQAQTMGVLHVSMSICRKVSVRPQTGTFSFYLSLRHL